MRTGEVKEIQLKGLSSARNDYECADGELQVCHNAVNTGDGLRPIQQAEVIDELPDGWVGLVFVHHTSQGDIHIMVDGEGDAWWKKKGDSGNGTEITEPGTGLFTDGNYQITSVGNVLVVNFKESDGTVAKGLHYYRWKEGEYKYIGQAPPDVKLEFATVHYDGVVREDGGIGEYGKGYITGTATDNVHMKFTSDLQFSQGSMLSYEEMYEDYPTWLDHWLGRINSVKAEMRRHGLFLGRFFIRTAYRLYDGTYIMQGAPVMIAPCMEDSPVIWPYKITPRLKETETKSWRWEIGVDAKMMYRPFVLAVRTLLSDAATKQRLKDWQDVIDRVCVFITPEMQSYTETPRHMVLTRKRKLSPYAGRTDETTIDGTPMAEIVGDTPGEEWSEGRYIDFYPDFITGTVVKAYPPPMYGIEGDYMLLDGNNAEDQYSGKAVVTEQDIAIAKNAGTLDATHSAKLCFTQALDWDDYYGDDETTIGRRRKAAEEFGCYHHIVQFERKAGTAEEQVEQQYLFYPLKEYTIDEALKLGTADDTDGKAMTWPYLEMNMSSGMWPERGETIPAPAGYSFVKFPKDTLDTLTARTDTLTDDYNSWQAIAPKIVHTYNNRLNAAGLEITFKDVPCTWLGGQAYKGGQRSAYGQVVIGTEGVTTAARLTEKELGIYGLEANAGFYYYPHPDAKRIEIAVCAYTDDGEKWELYTIPLKTHPYLHGAYFFDESFDLSKYGTAYGTETEVQAAMTKVEGVVSHPNYMYTSEVDNPFFFPSQGVNAIGSGEIVAIKSATKAMSEGTAFGAMPLYVFSTDGIWAMSVGTTGLFVATNPPSRETLLGNDPNAAIQIDNSIIFLSERGLMQLVGERTTLLSGDLQERFSTFDVEDLPKWQEIMTVFGRAGSAGSTGNFGSFLEADDFMAFIKEGARMAFDYINYRIIVFRPYDEADKATHTAFIYDIGSKMWATMGSTLTSSVEGFPQSLVNMADAGGGTLIGQFNADNAALVGDGKMLYTTRPMKLQKPDVMKTVRTLIERSVSHGGVKYLGLWGSRDMMNWVLIGAVKGGRMPRISGTPYKYFIAGGWSQLNINGDAISRLTFEEKDKHTDKLR